MINQLANRIIDMGTLRKAFPLVFLLLASSATETQTPTSREAGTERAWIVKFYPPEPPPEVYPKCLSNLSTSQRQEIRLAEVKYVHLRKTFYVTVEMPDSIPANVHDQVELEPEYCAEGKSYRISRVLGSN